MGEDEKVAAVVDILFEVFDLGGGEEVFGGGEDEEVCFFDFIEVDGVLVESDLGEEGVPCRFTCIF